MSTLRFSTLHSTGIVLVAVAASSALAQDPPPRQPQSGWDQGAAPGRPAGPPHGQSPAGPQGAPGEAPPGPPPLHGPNPPGGHEGARPQPPGPPMDFEALKSRDPELYKAMQEDRELERQTRDQAEQYRRAEKQEQAKIKEMLTALVDQHFAVRQQLRTLEVKRLEQQVKDLRAKIEQREKDRKQIVNKRLAELTGDDEGEHF